MNVTLCDHQCPLHESCGRYLEGLDRLNTYHYDPMPYRNGKCTRFVEIDEDIAIEKITNIVKLLPGAGQTD